MGLAAGSRLGPYEIVGSLGAGGMGEVYRARDPRLQRDVAVKVLPVQVAADPDRLSRFSREAQVLASLNHPHIAHVYGLEEAPDHGRALVIELVEGEDLSQRIARGAIPVDEAIAIAQQIADALDAAHERGIVHRDLKPANIKVAADGTVKVLDFGLAKAIEGSGGSGGPGWAGGSGDHIPNSPTITTPAMTAAGIILGTAAYMAPEQARGKAVDKRADIWAFGVVLYEMLTGKQLFVGETVSDTIAEVLKRDFTFSDLPADTPRGVRHVLERCLQRDPKLRLRDIGDARAELAAREVDVPATISAPQRSGGLSYVVAAALAFVALAIGGAIAWYAKQPPPVTPQPVVRTSWVHPGAVRGSIPRQQIVITPDGRTMAVIDNITGVHIRRLDELAFTLVNGTNSALGLFASPDSQWIGVITPTGLMKVNVRGGTPQSIYQGPLLSASGLAGASWGDDGRIYVGGLNGIAAVSADGGNPEDVVEGDVHSPVVLPGSRYLLYVRGSLADPQIMLHARDGGTDVVLTEGRSPQYVANGILLVARGAALYGAPLDLRARRLLKEPALVLESVALLGNASQASVSSNGSLIYYPGVSVLNVVSTLKRVAHDGKPLASQDVKRGYSDPRVSPDGRLLAFHFTGENAPDNDIWVTELARGTLNRLTVKPLEDETPAWSPDGLWIAYAGYKSDTERAIYRVRADGSGSPELLWSSPDHSHVTDWSGDGNTLVLESLDANSRNDILVLTIGVDQTPRPYLKTQFRESSGRISPDGKWLAYQSDEAGPLEIYVQAFPNGGGKIPISIGGGTQPVWSRDGRELYFRSETAIMSVSIAAEGSGLKVGTPTVLFADTFARPQGATHTTFDVFADGSFMVLEPEQAAATQQQIVAVFNWFEELKQKVRAP